MSTKEDILEQLVEEYLLHEGYFVQHNVKFRPRQTHPQFNSKTDANHSDIDVLGVHPRRRGHARVVAVSCKSWQNGFNPKSEIEAIKKNKIVSGRERWKAYRELVVPKWSEAFIDVIEEATGVRQFTYITAVTVIKGDKTLWESYRNFGKALEGNPIRVIDMREILANVVPKLSKTVANTNIGRILQLLKASEVKLEL